MEKNEDLNNFKWDETTTDINFSTKEDVEETKEEVIEDTKKKEAEEEEEKENKEEKETDEKEEVKESKEEQAEKENKEVPFQETKEEKEEAGKNLYSDLAKDFKDLGIFKSVEIGDDEEITEDKFIELQKKEIESRVDENINSFLESLDEESKAFMQYKLQGGSTQKFFEVMNSDIRTDSFDYADESKSEEFLTNYYNKYSDMESEDIQARIKSLKENEKLSEYAEKYHSKIMKKKAEDEKQMLENQKKANISQKEEIEKYKTDLNEFIQDSKEFKGINIDKSRKKDIYNFITNPTIKVGNGYITPMQKSLNELFNNKEALVLVANWAMNDFNVDMFKQGLEKKVVKDTKEKLSRTSKQSRPVSSSKDSTGKGIWEFFN